MTNQRHERSGKHPKRTERRPKRVPVGDDRRGRFDGLSIPPSLEPITYASGGNPVRSLFKVNGMRFAFTP
jgi:hypothetical protein